MSSILVRLKARLCQHRVSVCNPENKVDPRSYLFGNYEVKIGMEFLYLEAPDWELRPWVIKVVNRSCFSVSRD